MAISVVCPAYGYDLSQLDRGHRLLLQYGYQIHATTSPAALSRHPDGSDQVSLTTLQNANFTGLHFSNTNWDQQMWTPPVGNYRWSRWDLESTSRTNPSHAGLTMVSVWDEQDLGDPIVVATMASRLASIRASTPEVIGFANDAASSTTLAQITNYMSIAQPDMLSFDYYAFLYQNVWPGGSPTALYNHMGKYRTAALAGNSGDSTRPIPYAVYTGPFKQANDYALSESQMAIQYGSAWAYGYKTLIAWRYSNEQPDDPYQSLLFNGPNDTNPTPLYYTVARLNQQTQNLAPALLRLRSTSLQFVRGLHKEGIFNFTNDLPEHTSSWNAATDGNPYLTGIIPTNAGNPSGAPKKNDGLRGDVVIGHFSPLMEEFDGPNFSDEVYFMITNGLTDSGGSSADTRQLVRLNFNFGASGVNSLQRLDRDSGQVMNVPLVATGGSNYYLDWYLNGGEGDLFKYNTGAPFVGFGPSHARIIFQDNFQDQTVGGQAHNGVPQVGEGYYYLGMPHYGKFFDSTTNPPGGAGGEKFLGGLEGSNWYGHQNLVITAADEIAATNKVVEINLDAYIASTATTHWGLNIATFATGDGTAYSGRAFDVNLKTDGVVSIWDGATSNDVPGGTFRTDTWIPVQIVADYGNGTYEGTVDGFSFSGTFLAESGNNTLRYIALDEGGYSAVFVDNVSASIISDVAGDYNGDAAVDAADYVMWRKGIQPLLNEIPPVGTTDEQDYAQWRARFGIPSGDGSGGSGDGAVPEPTTALLAGLAMALLSGPRACRNVTTHFATMDNRRVGLRIV